MKANEVDGNLKVVSIRIPVWMEDEIERISKKRKIPKTQVYRMLLDVGIQCHSDLEKVGLIPAMDFCHYIKTAVKEKISHSGKRQLSLI